MEKAKMKNLRNFFLATVMVGMLVFGSSSVRAGLLVSDFMDREPAETDATVCKADDNETPNGGILVTIAGILVTIANGGEETKSECAIIVHD